MYSITIKDIASLAEIAEFIPDIIAGKTLQYKCGDAWLDYAPDEPVTLLAYRATQRRIKPEHKLRAWTAEEVPVGALFRRKCEPEVRNLIVANCEIASSPSGFFYGSNRRASYDGALLAGEHSTDGGATWKPCGVETV